MGLFSDGFKELNKDMINLRDVVLLGYRYDEFDRFRKIYNDISEEKIREGRQGIEQKKYLTLLFL